MNQDIETLIGRCQTCQRYQRNNQREPLEDRTIPTRPWQRIGLDLFYLKGATYLLIVDYFSKFVELQSMNSTAAPAVINAVKAVCARFGLPDEIVCDNGPPFDFREFKGFLSTWHIVHNPTAPYNPRSNGMVERSVQTLKHSLLKASEDGTDHFLQLKPQFPCTNAYRQLKRRQERQQVRGDKKTRSLQPLRINQNVWAKHQDKWVPTVVTQVRPQKRTYTVRTENGTVYRHNRFHLKPLYPLEDSTKQSSAEDYMAMAILRISNSTMIMRHRHQVQLLGLLLHRQCQSWILLRRTTKF
ncbi:uncharacterized protein K02A2.6-like [Ornithodoros turicata]|uniref:uncharacterized protein K02A2.6-like n=1 Tax=Ornithodoros turicata TaxID=34597 RepID=UPI003138AB36